MTVKTKFSLKGAGRDSYMKLVAAFPLASIKSHEHLEAAQQVMDRLLARGELTSGEELYLDALSDLAAAYEDKHYAIEPATGRRDASPSDGSKRDHAGATEPGHGRPQIHDLRDSCREKTLHPPVDP